MKRVKNDVVVYAEGGGYSDDLRSEFRQAFAKLFEKTELGTTNRPRIVACGSRNQALSDFCCAIKQKRNALLLVDSEAPINCAHQQASKDENDPWANFKPWAHLLERDNWEQPDCSTEKDCHLMVQCMESWFLADWKAVEDFFGQGFKANVNLAGNIELIEKDAIFLALKKATENCKTKAAYGKSQHSFKLLALVDPSKVFAASTWAMRFIVELKKRKT